MTTQSSNPYSVDPQICRQFYINGMWSSPVHLVTQEVFNPATEEVIAEVAALGRRSVLFVDDNLFIDRAHAAALFEALRAWRLDTAAAAAMPPYIVFSDRTLAAIASARPGSLTELASLSGVGPKKLDDYGAAVLEIVRTVS